ncbi:hypothetical protein VSR01_23945 [Actinacidiphila sp. DG2A-62]|uniref:hypothetical protein n=1 Tax=Actinacidiphila sp. DG2A-62 TaxID=3108821 RepID=UPI002DB659B4|nr:hypothetical protein [Actinacidiphila sp. DG2A-62]MEC3996395.1 hypothetical protein [Actinacidiphila sp. DG2A-62]
MIIDLVQRGRGFRGGLSYPCGKVGCAVSPVPLPKRGEGDVVKEDPWTAAVRQAREELGYHGAEIPRTVAGILGALRAKHRDAFHADLATLSQGIAFEVFLDQWWTQAVVDAARDDDGREAALEFADLAVALRISAGDGPTLSTAEVEQMIGLHISAEAQ